MQDNDTAAHASEPQVNRSRAGKHLRDGDRVACTSTTYLNLGGVGILLGAHGDAIRAVHGDENVCAENGDEVRAIHGDVVARAAHGDGGCP